jgi:hypothetical protein
VASFTAFFLVCVLGFLLPSFGFGAASLPLFIIASCSLLVAFAFVGHALAGEAPTALRIAGSSIFAILGLVGAWVLGINIAMAAAALVFDIHA